MKGLDETLKYLESLESRGTIFGLENICALLENLGQPHNQYAIIHIAGTNGKGSVATMIETTLRKNGYLVGKYTSPHLLSFNERITVNGKRITDREIVDTVRTIRTISGRRGAKHSYSYFDFTTALAFQYFAKKNTDIAVVEAGLGGRLDSTNVVNPVLSIITNISRDHTDYLGRNISRIAREKAGIIKNKRPVISGVSGTSQLVIREEASKRDAPLYEFEKDFYIQKIKEQVMHYSGIKTEYPGIKVGLAGDHQLKNAALVLCAVEVLESAGFFVDKNKTYKSLAKTRWPGRLERVRKNPLIIFDGAHNHDAMCALARYIDGRFVSKKKVLIFGVLRDKEYVKMLQAIVPFFDDVILTKPGTTRALEPEILKKNYPAALTLPSVQSSLIAAREMVTDDDVILVTGSLYTVGEAKRFIDEIF